MDVVDVLAVVGSCPPERRRLARVLADATGRAFIPAAWPAPARGPAGVTLAQARPGGAVIELPTDTSPVDVIATLTASGAPTNLVGIACVVDAGHMLADLRGVRAAPRTAGDRNRPAASVDRALLAAQHLEYASTVIITRWSAMPRAELSTVLALAGHLSPGARLRLDGVGPGPGMQFEAYSVDRLRRGWVELLKDDFDPYMTDPRVSGFRYQQVRPLHPVRLLHLLEERIGAGEFGTVVRSAGFCRLATRSGTVARWQHAGQTLVLEPAAHEDQFGDGVGPFAVGQDLAFIGLDLDRVRLASALDGAALTDQELDAGPATWSELPDPFPAWKDGSAARVGVTADPGGPAGRAR